MDRHRFDKTIGHAIAYVDVFMIHHDPDEYCELRELFEKAYNLSSQEIVSIIKENVKRSSVYGKEIVLSEMSKIEFAEYITNKLNLYRDNLISA